MHGTRDPRASINGRGSGRAPVHVRRLLDEYRKRQVKAEQSRRGYYDENGVRQGGLIAFIRYFWHILEPETPFVDGWPLWAICAHLESVTAGEITRLLMNVPPGFMKSMAVDVFWPAWEWGPRNLAHLRYVTFSYAASLTERDNGRFRDLVTSVEYQALWGDRVEIVKKGDTKVSNEHKGWKLASSVGGVGTGERGDRVILDDPHNVKEAESEVVRSETVRWFRESMSNRLNNIDLGAIIIIKQRVHEDDVSGAILSLGLDYVHLMVPMEFDWSRQTNGDGEPVTTPIGWADPRYISGDPEACDRTLAWEARFPSHAVERTKQEIGPYAWAGQYQQSPSPRGGGIFKREWWQLWDHHTRGNIFPGMSYRVASLDGAFTTREENDPSALTVWGVFRHPEIDQNRIMLMHAWAKRLAMHGEPVPRRDFEIPKPGDTEKIVRAREAHYQRRVGDSWGLVEWVRRTCKRYGVHLLLIEAKASGITVAQELQRLYGGDNLPVQLVTPKGDKVARAHAVVPMFAQKLIYAPNLDWADLTISEMAVFPKGRFDDLTDSAIQALIHLRTTGLARTEAEQKMEELGVVMHRGAPQRPLYPV